MFFTTFSILLPIFIVIFAGFIFSNFYKIDENTLTLILTDFFMPALVFSSLVKSEINFLETLNLIGAVALSLAILFIISISFCKILGITIKEFILPVCFMNTGFLGFPLMLVWGGLAALNIQVVIDQIQTFVLFTIGVVIIRGKMSLAGISQILKTPLLWAIIAGFSFRGLRIPIPEMILNIFSFCAVGTTTLAAFTVGCSIKLKDLYLDKKIITGVLLRFIGGFFSGWLASYIFKFTGNTKIVFIVAISLPSALASYILPLRYKVDTKISANIVIITTILGIFFIPLFFALAKIV